MTLVKALQMIQPFKAMPYHEVAEAQLCAAALRGKRELHRAAYRIRDAFAAYEYAVTYGKRD
ncbi:hypothetical protein ACFVZH_08260 [Streptomyces sp. NPDC059534]|uniref:hypothetical protein n=1 Tax=Streptomyces sp. NPDC059534 TaxID=3346859 RepID=UPI0036B3B04A